MTAPRSLVGQALLEIALIFGVFYLHGVRPTPDVGETNYLTKAKHFWNPKAYANDFYCNSGDAQVVYFFLFGWLTNLGWPLSVVAWLGRILAWLLLAVAWRGLSRSLLPRAWWFSVLSAELFLLLIGGSLGAEWIAGGVEAKVFAYALVLWGLRQLALALEPGLAVAGRSHRAASARGGLVACLRRRQLADFVASRRAAALHVARPVGRRPVGRSGNRLCPGAQRRG